MRGSLGVVPWAFENRESKLSTYGSPRGDGRFRRVCLSDLTWCVNRGRGLLRKFGKHFGQSNRSQRRMKIQPDADMGAPHCASLCLFPDVPRIDGVKRDVQLPTVEHIGLQCTQRILLNVFKAHKYMYICTCVYG